MPGELVNSTLNRVFKNFYMGIHDSQPPTFVQIIGWTKNANTPDAKRVHVYVRKVPLSIEKQLFSGTWDIDKDIIESYKTDLCEPILNRSSTLIDGTAILISGDEFIRYNGKTLQLFRS